MIPILNLLTEEITEPTYQNKTYRIAFDALNNNNMYLGLTDKDALTVVSSNKLSGFTIDENGVVSISYNTKLAGYELSQDDTGNLGLTMSASLVGKDRIDGFIDDIEAVIQAVYLILSTERYKFVIYSWDYGVELVDLIGKPIPYVIAELPRRIKEALIQDNRIKDVTDFEFKQKGKVLHATFTVVSSAGNISTALEVTV